MRHDSGLLTSRHCTVMLSGDQLSGAIPPARFSSPAERLFHPGPANQPRKAPVKIFPGFAVVVAVMQHAHDVRHGDDNHAAPLHHQPVAHRRCKVIFPGAGFTAEHKIRAPGHQFVSYGFGLAQRVFLPVVLHLIICKRAFAVQRLDARTIQDFSTRNWRFWRLISSLRFRPSASCHSRHSSTVRYGGTDPVVQVCEYVQEPQLPQCFS